MALSTREFHEPGQSPVLKEVMSYAVLTTGFVMFLAVHTASHKKQNCSGSSDPVPLKIGSLISSVMWAIVDLGGFGGGHEVGGGELTGLYWHATGVLVLGLLSVCDGFSGITDRRCGVTGGFPTEGISSGSEAARLKGVDSVS